MIEEHGARGSLGLHELGSAMRDQGEDHQETPRERAGRRSISRLRVVALVLQGRWDHVRDRQNDGPTFSSEVPRFIL